MTRPGMDLTCEDLVELVTDYLEGGMRPEDVRRFEDHLDMCEGCRNYIDQMSRTISAVGYLQEQDIPAEARDRLLEVFRSWRRPT